MPIRPPALDDRSFDDLVAELVARIPAHTDEWTHPRPGDPGYTLIELFAWLADTILYRANLVPERQRLAFLRLLGIPMRPAQAATTIVTVHQEDTATTQAVTIVPGARVDGPVPFETRAETTILPVQTEAYYKRYLTPDEAQDMAAVVGNLQQIYAGDDPGATQRNVRVEAYVTTAIFEGGRPAVDEFDIVTGTVDKALWLALLAPDPSQVAAIRTTLQRNRSGSHQLISIGSLPALKVPALDEEIGPRAAVPHTWEITSVDSENRTIYHPLDLVYDTTHGLTRPGVQRLALPGVSIDAPDNNVRRMLAAGTGAEPPRLDDEDKAARLVAWLCLRPGRRLERMALAWVGINAVEIDQRQTVTGRVIGQSSGGPDQEFQLPGQSVEVDSLEIQIAEPGQTYRPWQALEGIALAGRSTTGFVLDAEAGTLRLGDGVRGRIPEAGSRIRVAKLRYGGGVAGNLPPDTLSKISARDPQDRMVTGLTVRQTLPARGGAAAETLAEAERRIPDLFRHRDRAVTAHDYKTLAAETPAVHVGRVEVMPRFKPHQRREDVPGVVTVMALPYQSPPAPPNPRADRPFLEAVHAQLDTRRPLGTELYVIQGEYVPIGVSVGIELAQGHARETVHQAVRSALRTFLWPLTPGGIQGEGWQLGKSVEDRELEMVVARVPGVQSLLGARLRLFVRDGNRWQQLATPAAITTRTIELKLESWQLPELLSVVVVDGDGPPDNLDAMPNPFATDEDGRPVQILPVPIVPEVCH